MTGFSNFNRVLSTANDDYYKVNLNAIFITLFGELVIKYNMNSMTYEKFSLLSIT